MKDSIEFNRPKKVQYMCPSCFNFNNIKRKNSDGFEYNILELEKDFELKDDAKITGVFVDKWVDIVCECCDCGEKVTLVEIDDGMVDIIKTLNKFGYYTLHCCEGHIKDKENFDTAYVIFTASEDADDIFFQNKVYRSFPSEYWTINRRFNFKEHWSEVSVYMRSTYATDESSRKLALRKLYDFVLTLPDMRGE